jgi:hypothetical protein
MGRMRVKKAREMLPDLVSIWARAKQREEPTVLSARPAGGLHPGMDICLQVASSQGHTELLKTKL